MAVEAKRLPVEALAAASEQVAAAADLRTALDAIAAGAVEALGADAVLLRVLDDDGEPAVRAVSPAAAPAAAEVAGTRADCDRLVEGAASGAVVRAAERARADGVIALAARDRGRVVGAVEAVRREAFDDAEAALGGLVAAQLAV